MKNKPSKSVGEHCEASRLNELFPRHERAYFDAAAINGREQDRYVVWIDMMGARAAMERSLTKSAIFFAKVHDAVLRSAPRMGVEVVPITDGAFLLSQSSHSLKEAVRLVMLRLCGAFLHDTAPEHRFLIRGGIAAGKVILGSDMALGFKFPRDAESHSRQVPIGLAISKAYEAEKNSPPFGFSLDESAKHQAGPLAAWSDEAADHWHWWNPRDEEDLARAALFGEELARHYGVLQAGGGSPYPPVKMSRDASLALQYFPAAGA